MRKFMAFTAACTMAAALLAGCGGAAESTGAGQASTEAAVEAGAQETAAQEQTEAAASGTENAAAEGESYLIGICQLVQHDALDAATQGFKDAMVELLGEDRVVFDEQNASGDSAACATIVNQFVSSEVDLILANATASLQAASAATNTIPILGTSITDYATALNAENWTGSSGTNISGTSDLAPLEEQAAMLNELFPDARTVGLLYCSAEPNSIYQADTIQAALEEMGYTCETYTFADSNDIASVVTNAAGACDVIYVPTDNTAAANVEIIDNICQPAGVPVIAGEEGACRGCGVAALSINYYDIGYKAGEMAVDILENGADITTMPIQSAPNVTRKYVASRCEALGIAVPEGYEAIAE